MHDGQSSQGPGILRVHKCDELRSQGRSRLQKSLGGLSVTLLLKKESFE